MRHYFGCDRCLTVVCANGQTEDVDKLVRHHPMWRKGRPCVHHNCQGSIEEIGRSDMRQIRHAVAQNLVTFYELEPEELFRALCGYGLPAEIDCAPEVVRALLKSNRVVDVAMRKTRSQRTVLDRIDLEDGTVLHLSSSAVGATVYKITRKRDEPKLDHDNPEVRPRPWDRALQLADADDQGDGDSGAGPGRDNGEGAATGGGDLPASRGAAAVAGSQGDDCTAEDITGAGRGGQEPPSDGARREHAGHHSGQSLECTEDVPSDRSLGAGSP